MIQAKTWAELQEDYVRLDKLFRQADKADGPVLGRYICPNCRHWLHTMSCHCGYCGKRLDWR